MLIKNSVSHYGQLGRILHWTSVSLLFATVYTSNLFGALDDGSERNGFVADHISYGFALMAVMTARFYWRQTNFNPVLSYSIHAVQKRAAVSVHWFIYAVVIFQSGVGIAQLLSMGRGIAVFGVNLTGMIIPTNNVLAERLNDVHLAISNVIYVVLAVHITAAIYHQVFGVLDPETDTSPKQ